ncbi:MAG: Re/Si-specific NAD(P)(+) transhydrogenase subunit alpha [Acidimicrobiales bacterium]
MKLAVPTETRPGETRVATVPDVVTRLSSAGVTTSVQAGAGAAASFSDAMYVEKGATVEPSTDALFKDAQVIARVQPPTPEEAEAMPEGTTLISFLQPASQLDTVKVLARRNITSYSLDLLPRISRAQSMDALSSQATVSGYRAALDGAELLPKFFPMFMTAAGTVPPAKVLVLGAGVAGLQAIATARRLGAQVRAYDIRAAAKEEVMSLGASFVELGLETQEGSGGYAREQSEEILARQREMIANEVAAADVVLTTAAVPGRKAPVLVTASMVDAMRPGSVIVDMAADQGGNCELSQPGVDLAHKGVMVRGMSNPAASMPTHASFLYSRNIQNFVSLLVVDGELKPDPTDEILIESCVTAGGAIVHKPTAELAGAGTGSGRETGSATAGPGSDS